MQWNHFCFLFGFSSKIQPFVLYFFPSVFVCECRIFIRFHGELARFLNLCQVTFSTCHVQVVPLCRVDVGVVSMIHSNALWAIVLIMSAPHYLLTNVCSVADKLVHSGKQDTNSFPMVPDTFFLQNCATTEGKLRPLSALSLSVWAGMVYLIWMCPILVFGSVWGIGEGFVTSFVLADIWFLSSVWP